MLCKAFKAAGIASEASLFPSPDGCGPDGAPRAIELIQKMTAMRFGGQTVLLIHAELADIVGSDQAGRLIMSWIDKGAREFAGDLADSTASLHG